MKRANLRAQYDAQMLRARIVSEWERRPIAVALRFWPAIESSPASIVVQGAAVCGVVWEREAAEGARFRVLAVFHAGKQVA